jgi:acetyl esterase
MDYDPTQQCAVTVSDVEYRRVGSLSLRARIYRPDSAMPTPILLDIHGGGWTIGNRLSDESIDLALARSGIAVVAIDYRLAPDYPYPAQVEDTQWAIQWVSGRADELGSGGPIGLMGSSSGAHTAMMAAMQTGTATSAYVIALWPPLDSHARYQYARRAGRDLLVTRTEGYFQSGKALREANPRWLLERKAYMLLPPTLIIHGEADSEVPIDLSREFTESYRDAGGYIQLETFPDMPHLFMLQGHPEADRALSIVKSFITRMVTEIR